MTFIQRHLRKWLECVLSDAESSSVYAALLDNIYSTGIDILFNLDILRQAHDPKSDSLFESFRVLTTASAGPPVLRGLPRIFTSYVQFVKKYRGTLFGQGSSGTSTEEWRVSSMKFFASCEALLNQSDALDELWSTRVALLALVAQENLYSPAQPDATHLLKTIGELAISKFSVDSCGKLLLRFYLHPRYLKTPCSDGQSHTPKFAIESLSALIQIDYDLVAPALPRILPKLLVVSNNTPKKTDAHSDCIPTLRRSKYPAFPRSHS